MDWTNRAVTYHRVSTRDQDPELARNELRRAAALRGLEIVDEIEETGSGATNNRPGLERVLSLANRGLISHVLVWKLDRFGRSVMDLLAHVHQLERAGVSLIATSQGIEVGPKAGAMNRFAFTLLGAVAEFEREMIRERTLLGLEAARRKGVRLGRPAGAKDRQKRRRRWAKRPTAA